MEFVQCALTFEEYAQWILTKWLKLPGSLTHRNVFLFSNNFFSIYFFFFFSIVILFYIVRAPLTQRILESVGYKWIFRDLFSEVNYQSKLTLSWADFCDCQEMGSIFVQGTLLQVRGNVAMQVE